MEVLKWILKPGEYKGYTYSYIGNDGKDPFHGMTEAEWLAAGYQIMTDEQLDALEKAFHAEICGQWEEITKEQYYDFLDVLPPINYSDGGFFMQEPLTGNIHLYCQELENRFYSSYQEILTPKKRIIDSLRNFLILKHKNIHDKVLTSG